MTSDYSHITSLKHLGLKRGQVFTKAMLLPLGLSWLGESGSFYCRAERVSHGCLMVSHGSKHDCSGRGGSLYAIPIADIAPLLLTPRPDLAEGGGE